MIADFGMRISECCEANPHIMDKTELQQRTKQFALRVIRLADALPRTRAGEVLARQILRSGTSVASNYRAACRAKSRADFIAKMGIVEEEADETAFWLGLMADAGLLRPSQTAHLHAEAGELTAIVVASIRTARARSINPKFAIRNPQSR